MYIRFDSGLVRHQSTTNITEISLSHCTFGKQSIPLLLAIIKNNSPSFEKLLIYGNLTAENVSKIITGLDSFQQFQKFTFSQDFEAHAFRSRNFLCLRLHSQSFSLDCKATYCDTQIFVHLIQQTSSLKEFVVDFPVEGFYNKMLLTALKKNTTIKKIIFPDVQQGFFEECFEENRTIEVSLPFRRYGHLNKLCNELGITESMRKSVPKNLETEQDIRTFLIQLKQHEEQWRKLKMVFLGHGEVGKTTLLNAIKNLLTDHSSPKPPQKIDLQDRTVGVDVSTLEIGTGEASVWDFGGQLEYAVTHQFLLSIEMVVYILCYDYSAPELVQQNQISYWLDFLQSTLPSTSQTTTKWQIMIVGTKSDQCKPKPNHFTLPILPSWEKLWPNLPLHGSQYIVSSHKMKGVDGFLDALENICKTMFENHSFLVPVEYNSLVDSLKKMPQGQSIIPISQLEEKFSWGNPYQFRLAFKYLHGIGQIVLLNDDLVCLHPQAIPKIMAEFISPEVVQRKLMTHHDVTIMNRRQIGVVLNVSEHHKELDDKLALMEYIGVCFKLTNTSQILSSFLFPSLSSYSDMIQFTMEASEYVKYAGLRITAPTNKVFTSAFFCVVVVQFCLALNISDQELVVVHKNGIVVKCSGIFLGQMLVKLEEEMKSIVVLMLTYNPILNFASHTIHQLIREKFQQYDGYEECQLCPLCIQPNLRTEEIPATEKQREFCLKHEMHSPHAPFWHQLSLQKKCKSHNTDRHHIFVSYRVDAEGKQSPFTLEGSGGFVELVYWQLAPQKCQHLSPSPPPPSLLPPNSPNLYQPLTSPPTSLSTPITTASSSSSSFTSPISNGPEIFVFWDKMCLNDGCDWEDGFLHGITSSVVIVLLISNKVIDGICASAPFGQDNVLVEYECALLQNRKCGTPVIPVFVAEKDQNGNFVAFNFGKANKPLPTTPHARKTRAKDMIAKLSDSLPPQRVEFLTSVAKTLDEIFHLQGIFMNKRGEDQAEMKDLTKRVLDVLQKYLPQYHM